MKASKKQMIFSVLLCLLPILLGLYLWHDLPERIPTHFDLHNNPDGYSGKAFAVFVLPCMMAGLDALCLFGLRADPKAHKQSKVLAHMMLWFIPALSCVLMPLCLLMALGKKINLAFFIQVLVGVLFIIIGNYLPKCRQNYTMGIKLPWTLRDEENWNYTHRIGGFAWVLGGIAALINVWIGSPTVFFVIIILMIVIPTVASYCYDRKHKVKQGGEK